jgi:hypothetical protein
MLINTIALYPRLLRLIEAAEVMNDSQFGAAIVASTGLRPSRVVNVSVVHDSSVVVLRRYLLQSSVLNTQVMPTKALHVIGALTPIRLVNLSAVHDSALIVTKRYCHQTRVANAPSFGAPTVQVVNVPVTWNPNDKSASMTLSNGNLTVTSSASSDRGVRGTAPLVSGKYYFEYTVTTAGGGNSGVGVCAPGGNYVAVTDRRPSSSMGSDGKLAAMIYRSGSVYVNGTQVGSVSNINGQRVDVALDLDNKKIAFRVANGNWNGNAANNPATGAFDISAICALGLFPVMTSGASGDVVTANFGASAFSGSVPAGYTSGWPSFNGISLDPVAINTAERTGSGTATSLAILVSTQGACDVIIVAATEHPTTAQTISGVSGSTLGAFTRRKSLHHSYGGKDTYLEVWHAHTGSALSGETVTVSLTGSGNEKITIVSFAVKNAASAVWDGDSSLPGTNTSTGSTQGSVSGVSTASAPDFLFGFWLSSEAQDVFTAASGYAFLQGEFNHTGGTNWCNIAILGEYAPAAQSNITVSTGTFTSEGWSMIADAIKKAA